MCLHRRLNLCVCLMCALSGSSWPAEWEEWGGRDGGLSSNDSRYLWGVDMAMLEGPLKVAATMHGLSALVPFHVLICGHLGVTIFGRIHGFDRIAALASVTQTYITLSLQGHTHTCVCVCVCVCVHGIHTLLSIHYIYTYTALD